MLKLAPPLNNRPLAPKEKPRFGTRFDIRDVYGTFNECDISNSVKLMFFRVVQVGATRKRLEKFKFHKKVIFYNFFEFLYVAVWVQLKLIDEISASLK